MAARSPSASVTAMSVFSTAACFVSDADTHQCAHKIGSMEEASRRFLDERSASVSASSLRAAASICASAGLQSASSAPAPPAAPLAAPAAPPALAPSSPVAVPSKRSRR